MLPIMPHPELARRRSHLSTRGPNGDERLSRKPEERNARGLPRSSCFVCSLRTVAARRSMNQVCAGVLLFESYLWHSQGMKALKSPLASELLADPKARDQLRRFLVTSRPNEAAGVQADSVQFEIRRTGGGSVKAALVPKAKAA